MDELTDRLLRLAERLQDENAKLRADNERMQAELRAERARASPLIYPTWPSYKPIGPGLIPQVPTIDTPFRWTTTDRTTDEVRVGDVQHASATTIES